MYMQPEPLSSKKGLISHKEGDYKLRVQLFTSTGEIFTFDWQRKDPACRDPASPAPFRNHAVLL